MLNLALVLEIPLNKNKTQLDIDFHHHSRRHHHHYQWKKTPIMIILNPYQVSTVLHHNFLITATHDVLGAVYPLRLITHWSNITCIL